MKKLLVTGGMGFIGSCFIRTMLAKHEDIHITNADQLTYAGNPDNVKPFDTCNRYAFIRTDIANAADVERLFEHGSYEAIFHFAAESHVDRSISHPEQFVVTNVLGTFHLLEAARRHGVGTFLHVSTDEVYGALGDEGSFTENSPLEPNSPYSASKASSDLMARAYVKTYGLPLIITRCSNNYGPYQFPEKLIPTIILRALQDQPIPVYGDGRHIRDWLYVEDHCLAIEAAWKRGRVGEVYNIGGHEERTNIEMVRMILELLNKPASLITYVPDRLGHDRRYAINPDKSAKELAWQPKLSLTQGLMETVQWYVDHRDWWERVLSGAYREGW